jgi:hypothetical protein
MRKYTYFTKSGRLDYKEYYKNINNTFLTHTLYDEEPSLSELTDFFNRVAKEENVLIENLRLFSEENILSVYMVETI